MNRPTSPSNQLADQLTEQERTNLKRLADYSAVQSLPEVWPLAAQRFGDTVALRDPHAHPEVIITYTQLAQQIQQFAAGLQALGVKADPSEAGLPPRGSLIADNSPRWFIADQGMMAAGMVNAVRSSQADREELVFILTDSGSTTLIVENKATLKKLRSDLDNLPIRLVILLSDEAPEEDEGLKILNFSQLMSLGASYPFQPVQQAPETLATLIYTSGTSGRPKGVMLSHANLLHQVKALRVVVPLDLGRPGESLAGLRVLSILPTWHSYERAFEYFILSLGATQIYTSLRHVKRDLKEVKPNAMVSVPRLWESVYEGAQKQFREQPANKQKLVNTLLAISQRYIEARRIVQGLDLEDLNPAFPKRLSAAIQVLLLWPVHQLADRLVYQKVREASGGELKLAVSGGGSLARHLENFFEIVGIDLLVGYGLTETSPVTNVRRPWHNLRRSSGRPIPETEIRIVDPETYQPLPQGQRGLVMIRGPQVMQGYYQNPEATAKAIDSEGWFNSGDLGWVTPQNDLIITGRAKDTIVLTNGENIEPQPIEDTCLRSPYIDQIMLVGQDQRSLGALIVPNLEALQQWAIAQNRRLQLPDSVTNPPELTPDQANLPPITLDSKMVQDLFRQELNREVQNRPGYRPDDRIGPFRLILEPFSIENGMMTQTLKIRRPVVMERYHDMINGMFD